MRLCVHERFVHPATHSHPPPTACRLDCPTANSLHPSLTSFLPHFLPLHPPSTLLRLLQCLPELWETYPPGHAWGHTRPIGLKKKPHPNPSRQAARSRTGCVRVDVVLCVGASCLSHAAYRSSLFSPSLTQSFSHPPVWSVADLLVGLVWKKKKTFSWAAFFSGKHPPTGLRCTASAKSQQFSAEPLLFLGGTLKPVAAVCGHQKAGKEQ